jgi:tRNA uridine 5-carboxymethylaminomethyl modification enzyme
MRRYPPRKGRPARSDLYDLIVVGGGHAGCEAALAGAALGGRVLLVTHAAGEIGRMPCNPAIGGLGKGHLVRELDVLGGKMGEAIDATGIQFRILNRRKGPAVRAPRAQADKQAYQAVMLAAILSAPRLELREAEVTSLLTTLGTDGRPRVVGIGTADGASARAGAVLLATGTFLQGLMHVGPVRCRGGREGAAASGPLSKSLLDLGLPLRRLKTGTPPRLHRDSIDYGQLDPQPGDDPPSPFSLFTNDFAPRQVLCHLTRTTARTHALIRSNLDRSPLYQGVIAGQGPRYCPSIEDKVVRFPGRDHHLIFLEPEGRQSEETYVNGLSTSLPADVQEGVVHSVPGLERARIVRYGYAVEYDSVPSYEVGATLQTKRVEGLFLAGQILGTSGYEEAAAQGILAGINAMRVLNRERPFLLRRDQAYLGVLVDDLVTKEITEPYRMFTSRAEHRLSLRCDNSATRLLDAAEEAGILPGPRLDLLRSRARALLQAHRMLGVLQVEWPGTAGPITLEDALRRPGMDLAGLSDDECFNRYAMPRLTQAMCAAAGWRLPVRMVEGILEEAVNDLKYAGYIGKQERFLGRQARLDQVELGQKLDYAAIAALSFEAREKLARMRPATLGQASRIDGVRAADLAVLSVMLERCGQGAEDAAAAGGKSS